MRNDRLRYILRDIKARCKNPNRREYKWYGGRGITVCAEWDTGESKPFIDWALRSGYAEDLEIERIDNNLGYSPDNCTWVTQKAQKRNQRSNVKISYRGKQYNTISELVEHFYPNYDKNLYTKIYCSIVIRKWPISKAILYYAQ